MVKFSVFHAARSSWLLANWQGKFKENIHTYVFGTMKYNAIHTILCMRQCRYE